MIKSMSRARFLAIVALAIGGLLGHVAASRSLTFNRFAHARPAQEEKPISFEVLLPANATLEIDGNKTEETGETRTFRTPPLEVGRNYSYTLKASANGKEVTRKIQIAFGAENRFDLRGQFLAGGSGQSGSPAKEPRNIIFVICDQETHHLTARNDYKLPARQALMRHGVTFNNHYIASAMCSASRAAFLTGQPPQVNGVCDQMQYTYQHSLSPDRPNMGSVLKKLGYQTAYFGKFEMDKRLLALSDTVNYTDALKPYGFDQFGATGDTPSGPWDGYANDYAIASDGVRWLRTNVP
jgi:uncharacterized protein (TIGR03000 family)